MKSWSKLVVIGTNCFASNACTPRRRFIDNAEVILNTIRTGSRFRDKVSCGRIDPLDLNETFRTYRLVTASRMVDIRRIVLELDKTEEVSTGLNGNDVPGSK